MDAPPVRPVTPPAVKNLQFSRRKDREDFVTKLLQNTLHLQSSVAQQGFGSAFISEDEKHGSINDTLQEERERERWKAASRASARHTARPSRENSRNSNRWEEHPPSSAPARARTSASARGHTAPWAPSAAERSVTPMIGEGGGGYDVWYAEPDAGGLEEEGGWGGQDETFMTGVMQEEGAAWEGRGGA